jgi:hypothetical protein
MTERQFYKFCSTYKRRERNLWARERVPRPVSSWTYNMAKGSARFFLPRKQTNKGQKTLVTRSKHLFYSWQHCSPPPQAAQPKNTWEQRMSDLMIPRYSSCNSFVCLFGRTFSLCNIQHKLIGVTVWNDSAEKSKLWIRGKNVGRSGYSLSPEKLMRLHEILAEYRGKFKDFSVLYSGIR